ncbi:MFS transporter [Arthrobacter monumenti]
MLLAATITCFSGYTLLLATVPLWATRGGAGEFGAGATTASFMLTTVLTQVAMPWLLAHGGYRWTFAAGALLLGLPTPLLLLSADLVPVIAISAVRGIGFGMVTVVGAALSARLVPAQHLGRAAAYYGVAVGIPNLVLLSLGVWMALNLGFDVVFWIATLTPLIGAVAAAALWHAGGDGAQAGGDGAQAGAQTGVPDGATQKPTPRTSTAAVWLALIAPLLIMLALALASSAIVTFLAIPLSSVPLLATTALLGYGALTVAGRWVAGNVSDRSGRPVLILPSIITAAAGMVLVAAALWSATASWSGPGVLGAILIVLGSTMFGAAFGAAQNDTVVAMFRRAGPEGYGTASSVWNIGYDAGTGAGALGLGIIAQTLGYGPAFAVTAVAVAACLPAATRLSRSPRTQTRSAVVD